MWSMRVRRNRNATDVNSLLSSSMKLRVLKHNDEMSNNAHIARGRVEEFAVRACGNVTHRGVRSHDRI